MNNREIIPKHLIKQVEDYLPADPVMLVGSDMITFNVFPSLRIQNWGFAYSIRMTTFLGGYKDDKTCLASHGCK